MPGDAARDVTPNQKTNKGGCECGLDACELWGALGRPRRDGTRHVRGCVCMSCRGKRSKAKGSRKQAKAVTALGIPRSSLHPGHEEFLPGALRVEIKAGAQVGPAWTKFLLCEAQANAARAHGDNRPFVAVACADGTKDMLLMHRMSELDAFVEALIENRERA